MVAPACRSLLICIIRTVTLVSVGSLLSLPASAQQSQNWEWCSGRGGPTSDQRTSACSAIIESSSETRENLARAYGNRGVAYDNKGEYDRAVRDYDESVRFDPTSASGHRFRGNAYKLKNDYDHAIAEYNEAISLAPNDALAVNNRGVAYYEMKDHERAVADYSEAIRLDPAYTAAFYGRGLAYRAKRDTGHAIADFDEAIRLEPKFAPAFIARGVEYLDKKEYDRAIADYTEALLMKPKPVERTVAYAFTDRCWARFLVGRDLQDALDDCTKALNLRPNDATTLNARGFTYLKLGEFDRSIADFDAALTVNSKMAVSFYGRGLARRGAGDGQAADKDIEMARTIRADIADAVAEYGVQ
jgi:tetratricopeptide (TPR) repeat protein